jgi:LDH2 family malate/lactate/ureidoglycolate dehydrogenase
MGAYAEMAADAGMFGLVMGGGAHRRWSNVVPFGGAEPVMSTNPYALAMPGGPFGPIVADFATSTAADGKIAVLRAEGKTVPEGWILDKHGKPTTDPEAFFDGGRHLPAAGHKGYGLGLMAELIGDAALGCPPNFNWFVMVVDLGVFSAADSYGERAEAYLAHVKATPPAPGFTEVLLPGEPERRAAAARAKEGVEIPNLVWSELLEAASAVGLDLGEILA